MRSALYRDNAGSARCGTAVRAFLLAAAAAAVLTGCARRDSITVGSVPDDYRTNHPIVIAEQEEKIDLPVGVGDNAMSRIQRTALNGYLADYDERAGAPITILYPSGSANAVAAGLVATDISHYLHGRGIPAGRVVSMPYEAGAPEASPPIRVSYRRMKASTGPCGRWPADIANTVDNKHYANFGCAYQNNLAAQMANPADLLGPRAPGDIDAENRGDALDDYKARNVSGSFRQTSEVNY
ncbi:CpaD family pilus assembly protein [Aquibium microcysteis]|uniref:CpaD family pilus assembly protein n=1 Tax=Aquibium microcysteis TaxID=675281 RepID=UPI00165D1CB4|nr:CpaD family pilus assembly lipoprotein [Aquibium microcysteis]